MKNKKWYTMKALNKKAEITVFADIGYWGITAEDFSKELKSHGNLDFIDLKINSYGGEVFDGFSIYNMLKETGANITVTITGIAASIASYIAMVGNTIKIHGNAMIMIHNPSVCMCGEAKDLKREAEVLENMKDSAVKAYKRAKTNLTDLEISELMDKTSYITAEKALEYGFVDEVLEAVEVEEPETNSAISIPINYRKKIFTNKAPAGKEPVKEVKMKCPKCGKHDILEGQIMCVDCARAQEREEAKAAERMRINGINAICRASGLSDEVVQKFVDSGKDVSDLSGEISEEIKKAKNFTPSEPNGGKPFQVNKDESDKFRMHASNCLAVVCGVEKDPAKIADSKKDVMVGSIHALMRKQLKRSGVDTDSMSAGDLVRHSMSMGSSDLPAILADVANKAMGNAFVQQPTTYQQWCGTKDVPDFKTVNVVKMSDFSGIDDMPEGASFSFGKVSDKKETASVGTKGKAFRIPREALVNDDLDAISKIPALMAGAMARKLNRDVYVSLTSNSLAGPAMTEVTNMFHTDNGNIVSGVGKVGIPSVATISATELYLMSQKAPKPTPDSDDVYLSIPARYLITGTAQKLTVQQVLGAAYDISKSIVGVPNPYNNTIIPIFDQQLQALLAGTNPNGWYLAADQNIMESIGIAYLQGNRTPTMRSEASRVSEALGIVYDIFFDYGIYAADYRGIVYNPAQ